MEAPLGGACSHQIHSRQPGGTFSFDSWMRSLRRDQALGQKRSHVSFSKQENAPRFFPFVFFVCIILQVITSKAEGKLPQSLLGGHCAAFSLEGSGQPPQGAPPLGLLCEFRLLSPLQGSSQVPWLEEAAIESQYASCGLGHLFSKIACPSASWEEKEYKLLAFSHFKSCVSQLGLSTGEELE